MQFIVDIILIIINRFSFIKIWPFDNFTRFSINLIMYLLINFILAKVKICYILLIILFLYFNIVVIIVSKLIYKELSIMKIIMLFQISCFDIITTYNWFIKN